MVQYILKYDNTFSTDLLKLLLTSIYIAAHIQNQPADRRLNMLQNIYRQRPKPSTNSIYICVMLSISTCAESQPA